MAVMERINNNFWAKLPRPFFCLAPMSDVTDEPFRKMIAKYGRGDTRTGGGPDVFWTEFVAADGLADKLGRKKLAHILKYSEGERPIVAQVFGANPEKMEIACRLIASLGFDGIDINMGCPDKSVVAQGAGSALIKNPSLARKIIQAARAGIEAAGQHLPVSVKTRIGFNQETIDTWIPEILQSRPAALTVHLRTRKEESLPPAHWEFMPKIIAWRDKISPETLIIGNGDVQDRADGERRAKESGCDGLMIGRGFFGRPWLLSSSAHVFDESPQKKLQVLAEQIKLFEKTLGGIKSFEVMKKHFKAYTNGFPGAKELRARLMIADTPNKSIAILTAFQKTLK